MGKIQFFPLLHQMAAVEVGIETLATTKVKGEPEVRVVAAVAEILVPQGLVTALALLPVKEVMEELELAILPLIPQVAVVEVQTKLVAQQVVKMQEKEVMDRPQVLAEQVLLMPVAVGEEQHHLRPLQVVM
jgi:hypothetical protein